MKNYKMDFATKTLTITKNFAQKALCPNSEESKIIEHCRSICPDLSIAYQTRKPSKRKPYGGLTYAKMERYIRLFENADELLQMFYLVREFAQVHGNPFAFVYRWFVRQFPNYKEMPSIINGRPYAIVLAVPEVEVSEFCIA